MPTFENTLEDRPKIPGTAAFSKFMAVLQLIADQETPLTIAKLSVRSGYPRPTVYRILAALMAEGIVTGNLHTKHFELGPRLISLAGKSWAGSAIRIAAADDLQKLRDTTRECVHLAVPSNKSMVYIEKLETPQVVRISTSRIGTCVTLHSSSVGKAYLAALDDSERDRLLQWIGAGRADADLLRDDLTIVQQYGFAECSDEKVAQSFSVSAAIRNTIGLPVACVSISVPLFRKPEQLTTLVEPLLSTCKLIAQKLPGTLRQDTRLSTT